MKVAQKHIHIDESELANENCWDVGNKRRLIRRYGYSGRLATSYNSDVTTTRIYTGLKRRVCKPAKSSEGRWAMIHTLLDKTKPEENNLTEETFNELARKWKQETAHYSTMFHKLNNPNYLKIIGEGKPALRFILQDLENTPELWHEALFYITKANPIKPEDLDDLNKIREGWISWGKKNGYIA